MCVCLVKYLYIHLHLPEHRVYTQHRVCCVVVLLWHLVHLVTFACVPMQIGSGRARFTVNVLPLVCCLFCLCILPRNAVFNSYPFVSLHHRRYPEPRYNKPAAKLNASNEMLTLYTYSFRITI